MYNTHILTDEGARSVWENGKRTGYAMNLRINYYRGLPLCCVEAIDIEVDGKKVPPEAMLLQHQGREYPYLDILSDDFPEDFYWLFGQKLRVVVKQPGGIPQGHHMVKVTLGTRRSYTPTMWATIEKDIVFA